MLDFVTIKTEYSKSKTATIKIYPDFKTFGFKDLIIRGKSFYAVWDDINKKWSSNEEDLFNQINALLYLEKEKLLKSKILHEEPVIIDTMDYYTNNVNSSSYMRYKKALMNCSDNYQNMDSFIAFKNDELTKEDYILRPLSYDRSYDFPTNYDELMSVLYEPAERHKIEWAIGSIFRGDSKDIQKFFVFYGAPGSGKSTVLKIIEMLFEQHCTHFNAKVLTSTNNSFALTPFSTNPFVAIQHDGDLSRIQDNTMLNSLVSHEAITINQKYKSEYEIIPKAIIFIGTNTPVKISGNNSGIIRRLIDINPSGKTIPINRYTLLMERIKYELGSIAVHCMNVYDQAGMQYYDDYEPREMMYMTDYFYNFVDEYSIIFENEKGISLKRAWSLYNEYCTDAGIDHRMKKTEVREELKHYFKDFRPARKIDGQVLKNYYSGFKIDKVKPFNEPEVINTKKPTELILNKTESKLDYILKDCLAQYANDYGVPAFKWDGVDSTLKELDTTKLHYILLNDLHHIVIDFDLKDVYGNKDKDMNLREAFKWPETYAEFSKSGAGIHLHYIYTGDPLELESVYSEGIEIKVFKGKSALRRQLTFCNDLDIATISSGLPLKEKKGDEMLNLSNINDEAKIRNCVNKALRKEIHKFTKPNIDYIYMILENAYNSNEPYDVSDLHSKVLSFALNSSNHADYCFEKVKHMHFQSKDNELDEITLDAPIIFFDVEVFPNLFLINWKYPGKEHTCTRMINPTPEEVGKLFKFRLIGFNNRRYDNHMLYARYLGFTNEQLFNLSNKIISGKDRNVYFGNAYGLSYTDVYDFSSKKQSLKKFEIELGIHHKELGIPWNEPVPEDRWIEVAEYCDNDVIATEAVFNARHADFIARQILADVAGMTVNDTTNTLTTRIIFGKERHPQLVYTDLATGEQY